MSEQPKRTGLWPLVIVFVIILAVIVIWRVAFFIPAQQVYTEHNHQHSYSEPPAESINDANYSKTTLNHIVKNARTWGPVYESWIGKTAPDFTLTDINGKQHTLSDYRGKDVLLIFWATWCGPCIMEIPHLIALRNIVSEDKLAMLAISYIAPNNTTEMVRKIIERNEKINYAVFSSDVRDLPAPFNSINYIPCSFFIDPDGKIKLATAGLLTLGGTKAILEADWP